MGHPARVVCGAKGSDGPPVLFGMAEAMPFQGLTDFCDRRANLPLTLTSTHPSKTGLGGAPNAPVKGGASIVVELHARSLAPLEGQLRSG